MASSITSDHSQEDLQSIQRQIDEKKTSILDSTRRIRGSINESEVVGTNTAAELAEQREKLENIEKHCDGIDANLVSAQRNLNKLGSIFGGIKNRLRPPKRRLRKSVSQPQLSNAVKNKTAATTAVTIRSTNPKDNTDTYLGKPRGAMDDIELEIEDGIHDIHLGVNRLKILALNMKEELLSQEPIIDRLAVKIPVLDQDVAKKNKEMKAIVLH